MKTTRAKFSFWCVGLLHLPADVLDASLVYQSVDPSTESLVLTAQESYIPESGVSGVLPKSDPGQYFGLNAMSVTDLCEAYSFCAWPRVDSKRNIGEHTSTMVAA